MKIIFCKVENNWEFNLITWSQLRLKRKSASLSSRGVGEGARVPSGWAGGGREDFWGVGATGVNLLESEFVAAGAGPKRIEKKNSNSENGMFVFLEKFLI
jgi:hypothetical protein